MELLIFCQQNSKELFDSVFICWVKTGENAAQFFQGTSHILGIHSGRMLPNFSRELFIPWAQVRGKMLPSFSKELFVFGLQSIQGEMLPNFLLPFCWADADKSDSQKKKEVLPNF